MVEAIITMKITDCLWHFICGSVIRTVASQQEGSGFHAQLSITIKNAYIRLINENLGDKTVYNQVQFMLRNFTSLFRFPATLYFHFFTLITSVALQIQITQRLSAITCDL